MKGEKVKVLKYAQTQEKEEDKYSHTFSHHGHHDKHHEKVKELIAKFEKAIEDERKAFEKFVTGVRGELDAQIAIKKAEFAEVKSQFSDSLNKAVLAAKEEMDTLKADRKAEMDVVVAKKIAAADKRIKDLKWNYDDQVKARLDTQQKDIDSHTRSKVIWNLKNKKHNFFAAIWDIRKELSTKLSITKASLWKELQAESDALWASLQESKNKFAAESDRVYRELGDETDALRDELDKRAQAAAEWLSEASNKEATTLKDFLTLHKLSHGGFTISHFAPFHIVTPVFGLRKEAKKIQDSIYEMAEELMPIYEENVRGEIAQGESDKNYLVQRVIAQNTDLIDALEARTDSLIDTIMIERADTENALQTYQKELIQEQVDQVRDIEKRVTETKEAILDAIA